MEHIKKATFLIASFLSFVCIDAKPMPPFPITRTQADGSQITIQLRGDEHFSYSESTDGYLLLSNAGVLFFANNDLSISAYKANNENVRTSAEKAFLATLDKAAIKKLYDSISVRKTFTVPSSELTTTLVRKKPAISSITKGTKKFPVILVNSSNKSFVTTAADYSNQLNLKGYSVNGNFGSIRDYYIEQSRGVFVPNFDVLGPVTLSKSFASYTNDADLIKEAMTALDATVDFSQYDNDNDGEIDFVGIITAGQTADNGKHGIYQGELGGAFTMDSKTVNKFLMTVELSDNSTSELDGMGSFAHEFGHVLGLMDLYQLNGSTSQTPTTWDVMDVGCYNGTSANGNVYGTVVPNFSAFERQSLGWLTPTDLVSSSGIFSLALIDSNQAYSVPTSSTDEWFLVENRQQSRWDSYIPGHGLLIWHIDYNATVWDNNAINNTPSHQYVDIEEANANTLSAYSFPGTSAITSFTKFINWAGSSVFPGVYSVMESNKILCFTTNSGVSVTTCPPPESSSVLSSSSSLASSSSKRQSSSSTLPSSSSAIVLSSSSSSSILASSSVSSSSKLQSSSSSQKSSSSAKLSSSSQQVSSSSSVQLSSSSSTPAASLQIGSRTTKGSQMQYVGTNLFIVNENEGSKTVSLFNHSGQLLRKISFEGKSISISLQGLRGVGILYAQLRSGSTLLDQKMIPLL